MTHVSRTPSRCRRYRRRREGPPTGVDAAAGASFPLEGYLEGKSLEECRARLRSEFIPTPRRRFRLVRRALRTFSLPPAWRIAWASTAAVGWNAIQSYRNSRAKLRESREEAFHDD